MSKLLDRLDRIARGTSVALGFVPSANRERIPPIVLLARLSSTPKGTVAALSDAHVDAVIIAQGDQSVKDLEGLTWGTAVDGLDRQQMEAYKEQGSDFVVFGIEGTHADALEEGETARVLRIPPDLEESTLRGLEDLPLEAVLLQRPGNQGPLALAHLLAISNVRAAVSRFLFLEWDDTLTPRDLEHLRDMGVDGIVLDAEKVDAKAFKVMREQIDALPRRRPRGEHRPAAVLPRMGGAPEPPGRQEEDDEEEAWDRA